jgi:hypothetical protein
MSILRVANVHFESTGSSRMDIVNGDLFITGNNITMSAGSISDRFGNIRKIPANAQTASYILTANDSGQMVSITTGGVTVPNTVFSTGDSVTIYNNSASSQSITPASAVTMYLVGSSSTITRTLAQRGLATLVCVGANTFIATGGGLT